MSTPIPIQPSEPGASCESASGAGYGCQLQSDSEGIVRFPRFQASYAGTFTLRIEARQGAKALGSADVILKADPRSAPAVVSILSGAGQTTVIGENFGAPLTARVLRANGSPIAGAQVTVSGTITGPGVLVSGSNFSQIAMTDANGMASVTLRAPWSVGHGVLAVSYFDDEAAAFPQTTTEFAVTNARGGFDLAFQNLWWSGPVESGWGMSVVQHGAQFFNVLFVYDAAGKPTWYVQPGGQWIGGIGAQFHGNLYSPRGTPWFAYDAAQLVAGDPIGFANLLFQGERKGTLYTAFNIPFGMADGPQKAIVPQDFARGGSSPIQGVGDMWWGGPGQNGWGVAILEQPGTLFAVWFTYDESGSPTWFVMPGGEWRDGTTYAGTIYRTHGPSWTNAGYDASRLQVDPAGTFALRFDGNQRATMHVEIDGRSATLDLSRQPF